MNWPYKQLGFMRNIVSGMPIDSQPYQPGTSSFGSAIQGGLFANSIYDMMFGKKS